MKFMSKAEAHATWVRNALLEFEQPLIAYALHLTNDIDAAQRGVESTFLELCDEDKAEISGRVAVWLFARCRIKALQLRRARFLSCDSDPLSCLSLFQREAIRLKLQHGFRVFDIGQIMQADSAKVLAELHTGLRKFRELKARV